MQSALMAGKYRGRTYRTFRRKSVSARAVQEIVERTVVTVFGVPLNELRATTRRKAHIASARQVAMYLAHVTCGLTLTEVGTLFGRDRTTVAHACGVVEDRRDDPCFDRCVEHMEGAIARLAKALAGMEGAR